MSLFPCFAPGIPCSGRDLDVGSKIAIARTIESLRYLNKEGKEVFGFGFTPEPSTTWFADRNGGNPSPAKTAFGVLGVHRDVAQAILR